MDISAPSVHRIQLGRRVAAALLVSLMISLASALDLAAATKFVAKTGSDANDGTSLQSAYLTIAKGLKEIGPGGRLVIGGGTYEEAVLNTIPSGTTNDARTLVTNHRDETVTLRPGPGPARVLEFMRNARYITVAANAPGQIVLDGTHVGHNVVKFSSGGSGGSGDWPSHIRLENLEIKHGPNSGVLGYSRHCEFIRLHIHHAGTSVFDHGMYISGTDNVIDGCDIHHNYARGIQIFMSKKHRNTEFASRNIVRNCRIHHNGLVPKTLKPGIDADSGSANEIYNNLIHDNGEIGIMIQMGGTRNAVFNNTVFNNGTVGILIKSSAGEGTSVRNNIVAGNGTGAQIVDEKGGAITDGNVWNGAKPGFISTDPRSPDFLRVAQGSSSPAVGADVSKIPPPQR